MISTRGHGLGLGLAALGRPAYITAARTSDLGTERSVEALRTRTATVLDAAYAAGIRYIDTARSYGYAEQFLASWLATRHDVDDLVVASKWGYRYVGEWRTDNTVHEVKDHTLEAFVGQLAQTREHLGERVQVYQVHSLTTESPALTDRALHRALADLRDSGVRIGFSTSGPHQGEAVSRALEIQFGGAPLFTVVQSTWNLLEPSVGRALGEAADRGAEIVVKECLANGRLSDAGEGDPAALGSALELCRELGVGLDQLAMAAALAQPWASRVLTGAVTTEQIQRNLAASEIQLSAPMLDRLADIAENPAAYWSARSQREWA